jgi:hypothetical protein
MGNSKILGIAILGLILTNVCLLCLMFFKKPESHKVPQPSNGLNGPRENPADRLMEELNFSKEKQTTFISLRDQHRTVMRDCQKVLANFRKDFYDQINNLDSTKLNALSDSIAFTQKKMDFATFYHFKQVRELCDETQKKHFDEIITDLLQMISRPQGPNENRGPK